MEKPPKTYHKCFYCGAATRTKVDYGDFTQYGVRCLMAEYCMEMTLGTTGWGVSFISWLEFRGIAIHEGHFKLRRLHPKEDERDED